MTDETICIGRRETDDGTSYPCDRPRMDGSHYCIQHGTDALVYLFKDSGKYYTEERWAIPLDAIGPYDMERSKDFRRISEGAVLVPTQEPWGYPHLFPSKKKEEEVTIIQPPPGNADIRHTADYHRGRRDLHLEMSATSRQAWQDFGSTLDLQNAEWHQAQADKEEEVMQKTLGITVAEGMSIDCILERHEDCHQDTLCTCPHHQLGLVATAVKIPE